MAAIKPDGQANGTLRSRKNNFDAHNLKLKLIEAEEKIAMKMSSEDSNNNNNNNRHTEDDDIFMDTNASGLHHKSGGKVSQPEEPVIIFESQSNSSISQTARDQFAAALLRLQVGLDESTKRLESLELKLEDVIKQQQQSKSNQQSTGNKTKSANVAGVGFLGGSGQLKRLAYLGWPILVFIAMRAIERRSLEKMR